MPIADGRGLQELRSFGRRRGRKLGPRQTRLIEELLPRVAIDLSRPLAEMVASPQGHMGSDPQGQTPIPAPIPESQMSPDPQGLTPPLWLEVGFGGAEHLLWQAEHNPGVQLIGCEPFEEGVAKALAGIETRGLSNVRLHADDARPLIRWLPAGSLARCFILFPDPWPKKRHAKRRLVTPATLAELARAMRPGAELRIGTDIGEYARTVMVAMAATPQFEWQAGSAEDWRVRPDDWPETRYEAKAVREGRRRYYLRFRRTDTA